MIKLKIKEINTKDRRRGFAMLFAVLTASLLLTIGISIFNISLKELLISTAARESQVAFYSADSARECALYWDVKNGKFPACRDQVCSTDNMTAPIVNSLSSIVCNGKTAVLTYTTDSSIGKITYSSSSTDPFIKYGGELDPEADIIVSKRFTSPNILTNISASGHNVSLSGRRLERGLSQTY